jgi:hypothetical protein
MEDLRVDWVKGISGAMVVRRVAVWRVVVGRVSLRKDLRSSLYSFINLFVENGTQ